jgi:hypothetical protein
MRHAVRCDLPCCQVAGNHSGLAVALRTSHSVFFVVALNCMIQHMAPLVPYVRQAIETSSSWTCAFLIVPSPVLLRIHGPLLNQRPQLDIYLTENLEERGEEGKGDGRRTGKLS